MTVTVRLAVPADAASLCSILNPLIERGGTTANETVWPVEKMRRMLDGFGPRDFCHAAEAEGRVVGFQYVEAHPDLDPDTGDVATFVAAEAAGRGVGRALASASFREAKSRGWLRLHAYIRADNAGGLSYYNRIGFRTARVDEARPLRDGTPVDRVAKLLTL